MDATTYTGTGSATTINNADNGTVGFKPDLVWVKTRSAAYDHQLTDSVRGVNKELQSNGTAAEQNYGTVTSFNSNGFSVGTSATSNQSGVTYVGWQWVAGQGVNNTNTAGSVTSTVSANTTTGFSIVTWTGSGGNDTVGHGLSVAPKMIITKPRNTAGTSWVTGHQSLNGGVNPWNCFLVLNGTGGQTTSANAWNNTAPTSSVFTSGSGFVGAGYTMVAYCWAEVPGFSQFGSYTGNGSADGPFIYTGFRPKFVMVKCSTTANSWGIFDSVRDTYNAEYKLLIPNNSNAEDTGSASIVSNDFLSNGIKLRGNWSGFNANGDTYIYMAFAENPTKFANAR
jgi:hypothetical protein